MSFCQYFCMLPEILEMLLCMLILSTIAEITTPISINLKEGRIETLVGNALSRRYDPHCFQTYHWQTRPNVVILYYLQNQKKSLYYLNRNLRVFIKFYFWNCLVTFPQFLIQRFLVLALNLTTTRTKLSNDFRLFRYQ